jgi:hypothetical protein
MSPAAAPAETRRKSSDGSQVKRGSGQPEGRSARWTRKRKPNPLSLKGPADRKPSGGCEAKGHRRSLLHRSPSGNCFSKPQGGEMRNPNGNRKAQQCSGRNPEEPTEAERPRPEPSRKGDPAFGRDRTTWRVGAGGDVGPHLRLGAVFCRHPQWALTAPLHLLRNCHRALLSRSPPAACRPARA